MVCPFFFSKSESFDKREKFLFLLPFLSCRLYVEELFIGWLGWRCRKYVALWSDSSSRIFFFAVDRFHFLRELYRFVSTRFLRNDAIEGESIGLPYCRTLWWFHHLFDVFLAIFPIASKRQIWFRFPVYPFLIGGLSPLFLDGCLVSFQG